MSTRIPAVSSDAELLAVSDALNRMLARLEEACEAQHRFLADASHELRSPLANLRGTIEVALRRPRSVEEYRDALATALGEIERVSRLVVDLLILSRVDSGQLTIERAPCDLGVIARAAVEAHAATAEARHVEVRLNVNGGLMLEADPDRLREAIDNLLDNALRHAPRSSTVLVEGRHQDDCVTLAVRDSGPGLAPADRDRVFDRFYRADASRARSSGGTGLGLAIVKAIVEAHGGRAGVESEPGCGATFSLTLPACRPAPPARGGVN